MLLALPGSSSRGQGFEKAGLEGSLPAAGSSSEGVKVVPQPSSNYSDDSHGKSAEQANGTVRQASSSSSSSSTDDTFLPCNVPLMRLRGPAEAAAHRKWFMETMLAAPAAAEYAQWLQAPAQKERLAVLCRLARADLAKLLQQRQAPEQLLEQLYKHSVDTAAGSQAGQQQQLQQDLDDAEDIHTYLQQDQRHVQLSEHQRHQLAQIHQPNNLPEDVAAAFAEELGDCLPAHWRTYCSWRKLEVDAFGGHFRRGPANCRFRQAKHRAWVILEGLAGQQGDQSQSAPPAVFRVVPNMLTRDIASAFSAALLDPLPSTWYTYAVWGALEKGNAE
jgi:hypothetical protein